jgi:hypothetical protein
LDFLDALSHGRHPLRKRGGIEPLHAHLATLLLARIVRVDPRREPRAVGPLGAFPLGVREHQPRVRPHGLGIRHGAQGAETRDPRRGAFPKLRDRVRRGRRGRGAELRHVQRRNRGGRGGLASIFSAAGLHRGGNEKKNDFLLKKNI